MRKYLLPLLFIFIFVFESLFLEFLPNKWLEGDHIIVPRFLTMAILFFSIYGSKTIAYIYGFILGLLFDVVYTGIMGIYLFMFPLVTYLVTKMMRILQTNVVVVSIVSLIGVALLELAVYELNYIINITSMEFNDFLTFRLLPTLLLNLIFITLFGYLFKIMFEKYRAEKENN